MFVAGGRFVPTRGTPPHPHLRCVCFVGADLLSGACKRDGEHLPAMALLTSRVPGLYTLFGKPKFSGQHKVWLLFVGPSPSLEGPNFSGQHKVFTSSDQFFREVSLRTPLKSRSELSK